MTKEDALEIWLPIIKMGVKSMPECSEAVAMAIKALEQEPCDDCVSRQAVMDGFEQFKFAKFAYHAVRDYVAQLPPVKPEQKWIPVSERLPEKNGQYLVTVKKGYMLLGLWCGIKDDWRNVIAWMPLPEPYKMCGGDNE